MSPNKVEKDEVRRKKGLAGDIDELFMQTADGTSQALPSNDPYVIHDPARR